MSTVEKGYVARTDGDFKKAGRLGSSGFVKAGQFFEAGKNWPFDYSQYPIQRNAGLELPEGYKRLPPSEYDDFQAEDSNGKAVGDSIPIKEYFERTGKPFTDDIALWVEPVVLKSSADKAKETRAANKARVEAANG